MLTFLDDNNTGYAHYTVELAESPRSAAGTLNSSNPSRGGGRPLKFISHFSPNSVTLLQTV